MVLLASCCPSSVREISLGCDILRIFTSAPNWKREKHQRNHQPKKLVKWNSPQGLPGKFFGGTPFLNQKKVNLVYTWNRGGRGCQATLELPVQHWSQKERTSSLWVFIARNQIQRFTCKYDHFLLGWGTRRLVSDVPRFFLCTTSAKCFVGFRQQLQIHQHFCWCNYMSTGPPRQSSPPKKAPHRKQWNVILLFGCEWLRRLPLCLNRNSTDFRSIGMENSPSPEKNVRKGIEKVALLAGFQTHAWHLWSFWCTFIGSFSDSEWKKREELSAGKSFFGVIASAKEISQDLPWVTTGRSINSLKLGKDGSTHPTIFWGESL